MSSRRAILLVAMAVAILSARAQKDDEDSDIDTSTLEAVAPAAGIIAAVLGVIALVQCWRRGRQQEALAQGAEQGQAPAREQVIATGIAM